MADGNAPPVPKEALDYSRAKKLRIGFDHREVWQEEHVANFTLAKVTQADVLSSVEASLRQALERGETLQTWTKNLRPELAKAGWWGRREVIDENTGEISSTDLSNPWRLRTTYETNMRQARAAGQWQRIQRTKRVLPYLLYELGPSVHHREQHVAWAGVLLPADHPWWQAHMPMNGWGCKCRVRQVGQTEYDRLVRDGLSVPVMLRNPKTGALTPQQELRNGVPTGRLVMKKLPVLTEAPSNATRPWRNNRTGETLRVPVGIDPGFAYNPGAVFRVDEQARLFTQKLTTLPPGIGAQAFEATRSRVLPVIERDFQKWAGEMLASGRPQNQVRVIGALRPGVVQKLAELELQPESAAIAVRDVELLHADRDAKKGATTASGQPKSLNREELLRLPALIDQATAVLLDKDTGTLLYVLPAERREAAKVVVRLDLRLKTEAGPLTVNSFRTAALVDWTSVSKELRAGTLQLLDGKL